MLLNSFRGPKWDQPESWTTGSWGDPAVPACQINTSVAQSIGKALGLWDSYETGHQNCERCCRRISVVESFWSGPAGVCRATSWKSEKICDTNKSWFPVFVTRSMILCDSACQRHVFKELWKNTIFWRGGKKCMLFVMAPFFTNCMPQTGVWFLLSRDWSRHKA